MSKHVITGLKRLLYALMLNEETETYGPVKYFPGLREITISPKEETDSIYAENQEWDIDSALGEIDVSIDITDIPTDIVSEILGKQKAATGGYIDNANDVKPYIALMIEKTLSNGVTEYVTLYKGKFNIPEDKAKTKEGKPEFQSKTLTGRFIPLKNGMWKYPVRSNDADFNSDTWLANWGTSVIKAQIKQDTINGLQISSSLPADAANGVSISTDPTITFNNKISTYAVTLMNTVTLSSINATVSLDATEKILTIAPAADLDAATKYAIVVSKATDVYGQSLENAVIDFTTA